MSHSHLGAKHFATISDRYQVGVGTPSRSVFHIALSPSTDFVYKAGDAVGIYPQNHQEIIDRMVSALGMDSNELVPLTQYGAVLNIKTFLKHYADLKRIPTCLLPHNENNPDLVTYLEHHRVDISPDKLPSFILPLQPRFYSISSSPKIDPNVIELLVATFTYTTAGVAQRGTASDFLCYHSKIQETQIALCPRALNHFHLPNDLSTPILMVGSGTGIAPYKGFLQERELTTTSLNWLIFGERHKNSCHYYKHFLEQLMGKGLLKMDLAFSRDMEPRYVQHILAQNTELVLELIEQGAAIYICGRAKMGKSVLSTLSDMVSNGDINGEKHTIKSLKRENRLFVDIY